MPSAHGVQLLEVEEDAGGVDRVELAAQAQSRFAIEERVERGNAGFLRDAGGRARRLDAEDLIAQRLEMPQLGAVVRADVQNRLSRRSRGRNDRPLPGRRRRNARPANA